MKAPQPLKPTWWLRAPRGYTQQGGRAELIRLRSKAGKVIGWALYLDGEYLGGMPTLRAAKRAAAAAVTKEPLAKRVAGYSNFGGGGPLAPLGSPRRSRHDAA